MKRLMAFALLLLGLSLASSAGADSPRIVGIRVFYDSNGNCSFYCSQYSDGSIGNCQVCVLA